MYCRLDRHDLLGIDGLGTCDTAPRITELLRIIGFRFVFLFLISLMTRGLGY